MFRHLDRKLSMLIGTLSVLLMLPSMWVSGCATENSTVINDTTNIVFIEGCTSTYVLALIGLVVSVFFMNRAFKKTSVFSFIAVILYKIVIYFARILVLFKGMSESNTLYLMEGSLNIQAVTLMIAIIMPVIFFFGLFNRKPSSDIIDAT